MKNTDDDEKMTQRRQAVEMWRTRYSIAKRQLDQYEMEWGNEDAPERRRIIGLVNSAQQYLEDSLYLLRRAKAGL